MKKNNLGASDDHKNVINVENNINFCNISLGLAAMKSKYS